MYTPARREGFLPASWFLYQLCGSIVAAADFCVTYNFPRLAETHRLACYLADQLVALGVRIAFPVETNHVFIDPSPIGIEIEELSRRALEELQIRISGSCTSK
ncbi:Threonine aldolase [Puccinia graminis f. sp. tritici]|uniref:Threonine aldolase n=1 Tax=Puccinia graminis f. sp. tritici TaxID=56615 RepID=A0A5B0NCD8_PUCGR|nr:Threonine aldolase [Puccinia graminis f. sp. tritici]